MRFTFFIVALFAFIALAFATPIDDENQTDLKIGDEKLVCVLSKCNEYCRLIRYTYGKCTIFGNCACYLQK
ncbi:unnamed protein product [Chironomus riparius]|uniref:Uncharacterized protein n=1 Tax=Chironomus riparius TaxID=315576 RepID=A0A9N9S2U2_9DIPT|nr:unnamed protein product [Chironomus riparius]